MKLCIVEKHFILFSLFFYFCLIYGTVVSKFDCQIAGYIRSYLGHFTMRLAPYFGVAHGHSCKGTAIIMGFS